jgi:hypothetical protein
LDLVLSRVFLPPVDDKSRIAEGPIANGFIKSLEGLSVGDPDQNFLTVFLGQFRDPPGKEEVVFLHILRVIIEVLVIPLIPQLQTQLVRDAITVESGSQKTRDQGNDFEHDRFHKLIINHFGMIVKI